MFLKRNRFSNVGTMNGNLIDPRILNQMNTQPYYVGAQPGLGGLNRYGFYNEGYLNGDNLLNPNRVYGEVGHNPYLNHELGADVAQGYNNGWNSNADDYHKQYSQQGTNVYYDHEKLQNNSNIIGNPLIHEEVLSRPQGSMSSVNHFSNEPFHSYVNDKSFKKEGAIKSVMNQFKSDNGTIDFNKMVGTTSQLASAINQVSGFVKGVTGIFKVGA